MLDLSRRIAAGGHLELARRNLRRLGDRVTMIEPLNWDETRGAAFFDLFLDRRRWPELMHRGYEATVEALAEFRVRTQAKRRAARS